MAKLAVSEAQLCLSRVVNLHNEMAIAAGACEQVVLRPPDRVAFVILQSFFIDQG